MRTALISDIHGNYTGLLAVLADIRQQSAEVVRLIQVIYTHTSPREKQAKISDGTEAWNVSATTCPIPYDEEFKFAADDRYIACVGAIGYSRDGFNWLRYVIFDIERDGITFRAPEGPILVF